MDPEIIMEIIDLTKDGVKVLFVKKIIELKK